MFLSIRKNKNASNISNYFHFSAARALLCATLYVAAFSAEGQTNILQDASAGNGDNTVLATFTSKSNENFQGSVLSNANVEIIWPKDGKASLYVIYRNDSIIAYVSSELHRYVDSELFFNPQSTSSEIITQLNETVRAKYSVYSVRKNKRHVSWVRGLKIEMNPGQFEFQLENVSVSSSDTEATTVDSENSTENIQEPELAAAQDSAPDESAPITDGSPIEPIVAVSEPEITPIQEPAENIPPEIVSISLGCDLVNESIALSVAESVEFFLLVDDESPLDISYVAEIQNNEIAAASVDSTGQVNLSAFNEGETELYLEITDNAGLSNTLFISIVVN